MRSPRGFGKNYFTLSAITATTNTITLQSIAIRVHNFHLISFALEKEKTEEEDDLLLNDQILLQPSCVLRSCAHLGSLKNRIKSNPIQQQNSPPP